MKRKATIPLLVVLLVAIWGGGIYLYQKEHCKPDDKNGTKTVQSTTNEVTTMNHSNNQKIALKEEKNKYVYDEIKGKERRYNTDTLPFALFQKINNKVVYCDDKEEAAYYSVEDKSCLKKYGKMNDLIIIDNMQLFSSTIDSKGTLWGYYIDQKTFDWEIISSEQKIKNEIHLEIGRGNI